MSSWYLYIYTVFWDYAQSHFTEATTSLVQFDNANKHDDCDLKMTIYEKRHFKTILLKENMCILFEISL